MKDLLIKNRVLIDRKGKLALNPHWDVHVVKLGKAFYELQDMFPWCDTFREQMVCLIGEIDEPLGCVKCGRFVAFNTYTNKYNRYCSSSCVHLNSSVASATV